MSKNMFSLLEKIYNKIIEFGMPLGKKFFSNIFLNSEFSLMLENLVFVSYQQFVDFFLLNLHSILSVLLLFSIYIGLFLNMFHYSIRYYITNLLFSFQ
jgi:hypothetical protein